MNSKYVYLYVKNISFFKKIFTTKERESTRKFLFKIASISLIILLLSLFIPLLANIKISGYQPINLSTNQEFSITYLGMATSILIAYIAGFMPLMIYYFESTFSFSLDEPEQSLFDYVKSDSGLTKELSKIASGGVNTQLFDGQTSLFRYKENSNYLILDDPEPFTKPLPSSKPLNELSNYFFEKRKILRDYTLLIDTYIDNDNTLDEHQKSSAKLHFFMLVLEFKNISNMGISLPHYKQDTLLELIKDATEENIKTKLSKAINTYQIAFENYAAEYKRFKNETRKRKLYLAAYQKILILIPLIFFLFWGFDLTSDAAFDGVSNFLEFSWFTQHTWWIRASISVGVFLGFIFLPILSLLIYFGFTFIANYFLLPIIFTYSETLCFWQLFLLNLDLQQKDLFSIPEALKLCERRVNYIKVLCVKIPYQYSYSSNTEQKWAKKHFELMSDYLSERQKWLRSPINSTHQQLKKDFSELLEIYASRQYGNFKWQKKDEIEKKDDKASQKTYIKLGILSVSITGLILIHQYLSDAPALYSYALVSLSLYLIDDLCDLGILKNVLELTKNIIDLNK